jgi:hypothetical protein
LDEKGRLVQRLVNKHIAPAFLDISSYQRKAIQEAPSAAWQYPWFPGRLWTMRARRIGID